MAQTRKHRRYGNVPWRTWKRDKPGYHDKTVMMKKCGKKCFLGPGRTFPICARNTCKRDRRGIYAAYVRAREYMTISKRPKYRRITSKAKKLLKIVR
jgi:hypothetical protein